MGSPVERRIFARYKGGRGELMRDLNCQRLRIFDQIPVELHAICRLAIARFQLGEMSLHGPSHWLNVFKHATALAGQAKGADLHSCQLFSLLHDCERRDEGTDADHGPRAATYSAELHRQGILNISVSQLTLLCDACTGHTTGRTSTDPTVGVCWDADRLDLPRVGIAVSRKYLSTAAARSMIGWTEPSV